MTSPTHIRWMIRRDMPSVLAIERQSFRDPWTKQDFRCYLRQCNCIGMVAERGDEIAGYVIYELHKERLGLLNFAVAIKWRRMGIGREMVSKLTSKLNSERRSKACLSVRAGNLDAQLFFRSQGFHAIGIQHDCYQGTDEEAYLMEYVIGAHPTNPELAK